MDWLLVALGVLLLYGGGEFLVRGAVSLANRLGISAMVVGLTVVAFGTSAPELAATLVSTLDGVPEIAVGNVIGSNISNVGLILGLTATLYPLVTSSAFIRREVPVALGVSALLFWIFRNGQASRLEGAILLILLGAYVWYLFQTDTGVVEEAASAESESAGRGPIWRALLATVLGITLLVFGARFLVSGAVSIAEQFGVPQDVIGLTLVAFGTSLPELASSVVAALKRETDIILGNIVGSNIFNILAVLGTTALIVPVDDRLEAIAPDLWVMLAMTAALIPLMLRRNRLGRTGGALLLVAYACYIVYLFA